MKKYLVLVSVLLLSACSPQVTIEPQKSVDTIGINDEYIDTGCSIIIDHTKYKMDVLNNTVDPSKVGDYTITYYYDSEHRYTCQKMVYVRDQIAPDVSLNEGIDTVYVGENWVDMGVQFEDNYDRDMSIIIDGSVDTMVVGTYQITYTVSDSSGNDTSIIRNVHVIPHEN